MGVSPELKRIVRPMDAGSATAAAMTAATSPRGTEADAVAVASIRPVGSSRVKADGARIVQSSALARRCASAAVFASAYAYA